MPTLNDYTDEDLKDLLVFIVPKDRNDYPVLPEFNIEKIRQRKVCSQPYYKKIIDNNLICASLKEVDHWRSFEVSNFYAIVAHMLSLELDRVPLFMNSTFMLVKSLAIWRLQRGL